MTDRKYLRFPIAERIEHWVLVSSFSTLALTGLIQKFSNTGISLWLIALLGGIEVVRIIHRVAAIALMLETVYHLGQVGYKVIVRRTRMSMLPGFNDIRTAWQALLFNLRLRKQKPQQGRYTFEEKIEYWAVVWGTVVMAITGFMMWNPIATTRVLPGDAVPAAKAAHGGEAMLAVLAIIIWHLYHVHLRRFNKSMFTGYLSEDEMLDEHPLELADIKAAVPWQASTPEQVKRRRRVFFPVYSVVALALLFGIYAFVNFEETAIKTVPPPEQVVIFVPLTPTPFPTAQPTQPPTTDAPSSWRDGFDVLSEQRCGTCHSATVQLGGLNLSSYPALLAGGDSGPAVVVGDPDASLIVLRQSTGDHPGQLSGEELVALRRWIEDGAPED